MRFTFYLVAVLACVSVVNGQASMEDVMQHDEACKWRQTFARRPPETAGRALQLAAVSSGTPRCRCMEDVSPCLLSLDAGSPS